MPLGHRDRPTLAQTSRIGLTTRPSWAGIGAVPAVIAFPAPSPQPGRRAGSGAQRLERVIGGQDDVHGRRGGLIQGIDDDQSLLVDHLLRSDTALRLTVSDVGFGNGSSDVTQLDHPFNSPAPAMDRYPDLLFGCGHTRRIDVPPLLHTAPEFAGPERTLGRSGSWLGSMSGQVKEMRAALAARCRDMVWLCRRGGCRPKKRG